jgi:4'-phosphopantetheinyl transferase
MGAAPAMLNPILSWPSSFTDEGSTAFVQTLGLEVEQPGAALRAGFCMVRSSGGQNAPPAMRRQNELLLGRQAVTEALSVMIPGADAGEVQVIKDVFGKPYIQTPAGVFGTSISHSRDLAVSLVFPIYHPMALDVEAIVSERLCETIAGEMTPRETDLFHALGLAKISAYTLNWTIKEAYAKALGTGLTTPFTVFEVRSIVQKGDAYFESALHHFTQYRAHTWICGNYVLSVVAPASSALRWSGLKKERPL